MAVPRGALPADATPLHSIIAYHSRTHSVQAHERLALVGADWVVSTQKTCHHTHGWPV